MLKYILAGAAYYMISFVILTSSVEADSTVFKCRCDNPGLDSHNSCSVSPAACRQYCNRLWGNWQFKWANSTTCQPTGTCDYSSNACVAKKISDFTSDPHAQCVSEIFTGYYKHEERVEKLDGNIFGDNHRYTCVVIPSGTNVKRTACIAQQTGGSQPGRYACTLSGKTKRRCYRKSHNGGYWIWPTAYVDGVYPWGRMICVRMYNERRSHSRVIQIHADPE